MLFFPYTNPGHSDVPKGPLQKYLRTTGSRKRRQAKRHLCACPSTWPVWWGPAFLDRMFLMYKKVSITKF
eukprot:1142234-Pelagomonas_calceolata.AAC.2